MAKSKRERENERVGSLSLYYSKWTDEKLLALRNTSAFSHVGKEYKAALNNEIKLRGLKIN